MFDFRFLERRPLIVGLEIGTAKVCALVGEITNEGALTIIGIGQSASRGVRKGEIVEPNLAEEDVRLALAEAERSADVEIRSVYLGSREDTYSASTIAASNPSSRAIAKSPRTTSTTSSATPRQSTSRPSTTSSTPSASTSASMTRTRSATPSG